jgi:hypothetical protein
MVYFHQLHRRLNYDVGAYALHYLFIYFFINNLTLFIYFVYIHALMWISVESLSPSLSLSSSRPLKYFIKSLFFNI